MLDFHHFLFFSDQVEADRLYLDEAETRHAAAVLRCRKGDRFCATDGAGTVYSCRCESVTKKQVTGTIISRESVPRHSVEIHLFIGLPERGAFEEILVTAAALGVIRITPLVCTCCQRAWWERAWERDLGRFRGKMAAAAKQALYPYLPRLDAPLTLKNAGSLLQGFCLVGDRGGAPFSAMIERLRTQHPPFACVIGPPGGFTAEEVTALEAHGAIAVKIAPTRLTTQLSAAVLCGQLLGGRLTLPPPAHPAGTAA